jgi:prophage regulatory protein
MQTISIPDTGFLRLPEILKLIPVGRSTWWAGVKEGRFPQPLKLGPKTTVWRAEDIRSYLNNPEQRWDAATAA